MFEAAVNTLGTSVGTFQARQSRPPPQTRAAQGQIWLRRSLETTCVESEQSGPLTPPSQHQLGRDQSGNQSVVIVLVNTVAGNEAPRRARKFAASRNADGLLWERPGDRVRL